MTLRQERPGLHKWNSHRAVLLPSTGGSTAPATLPERRRQKHPGPRIGVSACRLDGGVMEHVVSRRRGKARLNLWCLLS